MTRNGLNIPFPLGGLSEQLDQTNQEDGTTQDALNVRGRDPMTGRYRGAQREGLRKFMASDQALSGKVESIMSIAYDQRNIVYSNIAGPQDGDDVVKSYTTPDGGPCYAGVVDAQENVYTFSGRTSLIKLNSELKLVWEHGIKVLSKNQELRTVAVDSVGGIYVGATIGGDQDDASVWRVEERLNDNDEPEPQDKWNVQPGGFVKHLEVKNGVLYVMIDRPEDGKSEIVVYVNATTSTPTEVRRFEIPYPAAQFDVNGKGEIAFTCPLNSDRGFDADGWLKTGIHPASPETTARAEGWTIRDHEGWEKQLFFEIDGDFISSSGNPEEGEEVSFWESQDKRGRHLYQNDIDSGETNPTWTRDLAGLGAVRFNGVNQSLVSGPATTNLKANASSQATSIPCYEGAQFALFVLCKITKESDATSPESEAMGAIFHQKVRGGNAYGAADTPLESPELNIGLYANTGYPGATMDGSIGRIAYRHTAVGGTTTYAETTSPTLIKDFPRWNPTGTTYLPASMASVYKATHDSTIWDKPIKDEYYNEGDYQGEEDWLDEKPATLITIIFDGSVDAQTVDTDATGARSGPVSGKTRGLVRVDGRPMDRWTDKSIKAAVDAITRWGVGEGTGLDGHFSGLLYHVVCLDRRDRNDDTTEPKIITHPEDPDYIKSLTLGSGGTGYGASGRLRAIIQAGTTSPCGGAHQPRSGNADYGEQGTAGMADYLSWVDIGSYTATAGVVDSVTLDNDSGWGWLANMTVLPEDDTIFGGGGLGAAIEGIIHENYSGSSVLDDDTTTLEKIEGWMCHRRGVGNILVGPEESVGIQNRWLHPYRNRVPLAPDSDGNYRGDVNELLKEGPIVGKFDSSGNLLWAFGEAIGVGQGPKAGLSVRFLSDGSVVSFGSQGSTHGSSKISKDGASVFNHYVASETPSGPAVLAVDEFNAYHLPFVYSVANSANRSLAVINGANGSALSTIDLDSELTADARDVYAVAVTPASPDYGSDISSTLFRAQHAYLFCSSTTSTGATGKPNVYKFELLASAPSSNAARGFKHYAIGNDGELKSFTKDGNFANLTTGDASPDFSATAKLISHTSLFSKIYVTDGETVRVIDPAANSIATLEAEDGGKIPEHPRFVTSFRGRLVLAGLADDPHAYGMSEKDNPLGWNVLPIDELSTGAVSGGLTIGGKPQDVINAVHSYMDDLLIFGGQSSTWILSGDPLSNGQLDRVMGSKGVAFGSTMCDGPSGHVFFYSTDGGIYRMVPDGSAPVDISSARIRRRLEGIDLSTHRVELIWNDISEGLHVLQVPIGSGGTTVRGWFWESQTDSWWEDEFGSTDVQPTAIGRVHADSAVDHFILVGGEDGKIRYFDRSAKDDDGSPIVSRCRFGPIIPKSGEGKDFRFSHVAATLASGQDGAILEMRGAAVADEPGDVEVSAELDPGRNEFLNEPFRAGYAFIDILNAEADQRWAFSDMSVRAYPAGRRKS